MPINRLTSAALGVLLALGTSSARPAAAQFLTTAAAATPVRAALPAAEARGANALAHLPFTVGERLEYDAKVGPLKVGRGSMEVRGVESVRGQDALHVAFRVSGGALGFKVRDALDSWIEPQTLSSLRFHQQLVEGRRERTRQFEIFPERATFAESGKPEERGHARPLDDAAFFYYVRTLPLEVGRTYAIDRYFRPDRNPVSVRVLRKERVTVPAGTFDAIVVQPSFKTKGLFAESAKTELWLSDDGRRVLLKMQSQLPFGSLSLHLRNAHLAP